MFVDRDDGLSEAEAKSFRDVRKDRTDEAVLIRFVGWGGNGGSLIVVFSGFTVIGTGDRSVVGIPSFQRRNSQNLSESCMNLGDICRRTKSEELIVFFPVLWTRTHLMTCPVDQTCHVRFYGLKQAVETRLDDLLSCGWFVWILLDEVVCCKNRHVLWEYDL